MLFFSFMLLMLMEPSMPGRAQAGSEGDVSVRALVERDTVSLGEPFSFQIQIEGGDLSAALPQPDMSGLKDFSVESLGGQNNSSSSITIINGKMSKVESHGYIYSFRLTPKKTGRLVIPSIAVPVDSKGTKVMKTDPIEIRVTAPETSDDFKLEVNYSKTRFYVGEPVVVTVTWFISRDVESVSFNLPVLETDGLTVTDPKQDQDPGKQYVQLPLGQSPVVAEKGQKTYQGRNYTTLTFRKVILAKKPGELEIPESTVSCTARVGYARSGGTRNPFDGFFNDDFFNPARRELRKSFVAGSKPVLLTALPLPEDGRPADFSGLVGSFKIETSATPTDVSVGDPITLNVSIGGSNYLENIELPSLSKDPAIEKDFKVPDEMAAGIVKDGRKLFSQTLRAKSEHVKAIPPLRLSYFDPGLGKYEVASSRPIALNVKPNRVVTAADVEGRAAQEPVRNELEAWSRGIAFNYEGPDVLENQKFSLGTVLHSPLWLIGLFLPFSLYWALFIAVKAREKKLSDPQGLRSRKALASFKKRVEALLPSSGEGCPAVSQTCSALLDALRNFLGDKLGKEGEALTFSDVRAHLENRNIDNETISRLAEIFSLCEQGRYGGGIGSSRPMDSLVREALALARNLDQML